MATSQNGWKAGSAAEVGLTSVTVPGTTVKLPVKSGDVSTVLLWVATRWHHEVEPLVEPGNWGYADRNVRGSVTDVSNHASGTAIDLNAPKHPLGTSPAKTMSKAQITAAERIEADSGGVVRWGGSYTGRQDAMHWEINANSAAVATFAARLRGTPSGPVKTPTSPPAPTLTPAQIEENELMSARDDILAAIAGLDSKLAALRGDLTAVQGDVQVASARALQARPGYLIQDDVDGSPTKGTIWSIGPGGVEALADASEMYPQQAAGYAGELHYVRDADDLAALKHLNGIPA